jgi:S1-C subfamily serine protease
MMKKILSIILLFIASFTLAGCEYLIPMPESELQSKLMSSRDSIRMANVGVFLEVHASRITDTSCNFESKGSGIVYKEDNDYYYVLTNLHVIDSKDCETYDLSIYLLNHIDENDTVSAYKVVTDETYDLAVIRFLKDDLTVQIVDVTHRLDKPLLRGEMVLSVGNPSGIDSVVTYGEFMRYTDIDQVDFPVIYHSAIIYSGNSGGALTDIDGYLIGINTWGSPTTNQGLAIPLEKIHEFLESHDLLP